MTTEPHQCRSVSIRAIPHKDEGRTTAQTIAAIRDRFPKCFTLDGLAIPAKLAARENAARLKAIGQSPLDVSNPTGINAAPASHTAALRKAFEDRRAARDMAMLDYLSDDFRTSGDVATRFKISIETAQSSLRLMKDKGLIVTAKTRRTTIYRKATLEAAE